jgi:hypothetical protein
LEAGLTYIFKDIPDVECLVNEDDDVEDTAEADKSIDVQSVINAMDRRMLMLTQ